MLAEALRTTVSARFSSDVAETVSAQALANCGMSGPIWSALA